MSIFFKKLIAREERPIERSHSFSKLREDADIRDHPPTKIVRDRDQSISKRNNKTSKYMQDLMNK